MVDFEICSTVVHAKPRKLSASWTIESRQELRKSCGFANYSVLGLSVAGRDNDKELPLMDAYEIQEMFSNLPNSYSKWLKGVL